MPWKLVALASASRSVAQAAASTCLTLWETASDLTKSMDLVRKFLDPAWSAYVNLHPTQGVARNPKPKRQDGHTTS